VVVQVVLPDPASLFLCRCHLLLLRTFTAAKIVYEASTHPQPAGIRMVDFA
jgi:hypothetical protein